MNCIYFYKNHKFNSELELDDFLLDKGPELIDEFGDEAFQQRSDEQLDNMSACEKLSYASYDLKQQKNSTTQYNPSFQKQEVIYSNAKPVTEFLEGLKENGRLLFPKFKPEEYFPRRVKKWQEGEFSKKELQDFAEEPEFKDGKIPSTLSQELIERLIKIETTKWENLAETGTAIHKLCEMFFSRYDFKHGNGKEKNYGIWGDKSDQDILAHFYNHSGEQAKKFLTRDNMKSVLEYCKELRRTIESRYGGGETGFVYYPELRVKGKANNPETNEEVNLIGTIDLLVVPPKGTPFIVDYKISPADYWKEAGRNIPFEQLSPEEYSSAKKRAFNYQLSTYGRILRQKNSTFAGMAICVAPAQLENYRKEDGNWKFDGINLKAELLDNITTSVEYWQKIQERLDSIFSDVGIANVEDKKILQMLREQLLKWFTQYEYRAGEWSLADIKDLIDNGKQKIEEDETAMNDQLRFSYILDGKKLYANSKQALFIKIQSQLNSYSRTIQSRVRGFKDAVKHANAEAGSLTNRLEHEGGDVRYYEDFLKKYVESGTYEVVEDGVPKAFEHLGIVLLQNKITKNIEVLKLTTQMITRRVDPRNKNKLITQCFASDIVDKSSTNFLLDAVQGNVELLETMLAINLIPRVFRRENAKVHSIQLVNPYINSGLTASNKQLLYAYKTMLKYKAMDEGLGSNNLYYAENKGGSIKFCTAAEQALETLRTGINLLQANKGEYAKNLKVLRNKCLNPLEEILIEQTRPQSELEQTLYDAIIEIEELDKTLKTKQLSEIDFSTSPQELQVQYQSLLRAYAEVKGYDFKQQVQAYSDYCDNVNILLEGHSGLRTDNPGTTASDNLNKITEFIDDCYKRVTDSMHKTHAKSQNMIKKLKKSKNISYLGDSTFQNSIRIYDNMTKIQEDGDWVFVNPFDEVNVSLSREERDFLKYAVTKINSNRFRTEGESEEAFTRRMIKKINEGAIEWLRVPLAYKGTQGKLETQGLLEAAKDYFYSFKPSEVKKRLKLKFSHLLTPQGKQNRDDIYAMRTMFDYGEDPEERMKMLQTRRNEYDHDLQSILLKHMFGYSLKNESEKAFILIKGAYGDILFQEYTQNRENEAEKNYLQDNVKIMTGNKLMSDKELMIHEYAQKIMKMASIFALGFSPKQIYQLLEGIYKDIGIIWRNEDGRFGFTLQEMMTSFADVYKEMWKFGYTPTKLERLNELYRINDMDINVYAQHLQNSHNIIRNFSSFLFRFASRPDFYNRMTIFESYMRHDGTFDAYQLNDEGELVYHFDLDTRFDALVANDKSNPKYKEQEALYLAMAKQFEREGAIYADGTKFKLETDKNGKYKPLPQAYTNKQARSYKSMADKMYGYYSHEKKALMQSSLIGALFWQMNTYWSGKKNQWFAISSVKDRGHFNHYSEVVLDENGQPVIENGKEKREYFYYQVDDQGYIMINEPPVRESELKNQDIKVPFYQWEGNFSEGIAVTISSMLYDAIALGLHNSTDGKEGLIQLRGDEYSRVLNPDGTMDRSQILRAVYDQYWNNPNENLRTAYRQNIRQFVYDMGVLITIGGIVGSQIHSFVRDYTHDHKDDHTVQQGLANASLALSEAIFRSAVLDFNPVESIGGRGLNWTPFAISQMERTIQNLSRAVTGDLSMSDAILNTFSFNRYTVKPFIKQTRDPELEKEQKEELTPEEKAEVSARMNEMSMLMSIMSPTYAQ